MHISSDLNYLEILDAHGCPAKEGEPGMVTVTSLTNYGFPFIRYQLADIARFSARQCACGRSQPMLEVIEGRLVDMFRTRDGRLISGHFELEAMFEVEGIVQFKMIQKSLDLVLVQLVLNNSFQRSHLDFIERTIRTQLGSEVAVKFEFPDSIPESSGRKYRYAICEIS
jgi:phenylacetate-CoA ligase